MKRNSQELFQDYTRYTGAYPVAGCNGDKPYLKPKDISSRDATMILNRLNSINSTEQLQNTFMKHCKQLLLNAGDVRQILDSKEELGEFQNLKQVAAVRRIGAKKFDLIVRVLCY
ncbi:hypothetical protein ACFLXC_02315 [Chloroflexota bacterium]